MRIFTAEEMRQVDRTAIEEVGLPSLVLMENAALGLMEAVAEAFPDAEDVVILCGPGNNGGDGLALARHLDCRGYRVHGYLVTGGKELSGDAGVQLAVCRHHDVPLTPVEGEGDVAAVLDAVVQADLVVDALFGTGLGRPLEGMYADLVEGLNALPVPVLAVDLPSGLNGSRAEVFGPHVIADVTVSFAAPKVAHVFPPTAGAAGELIVTDLGVPPALLDGVAAEDGLLDLLLLEELAGLLPPRAADGHKGTYGHVLVVAGAPGRSGAAVMTCRGAVRGGAGLVTAAVPEPLLPTVDAGSLESMTVPLDAGPDGEITAAAVEALLAVARDKDVVALGPGLGQGEGTAAAMRHAVLRLPLPLVLDADGCNAFAGRLAELAQRTAPTVLTPHPGELGRLLGESSDAVQADRVAAARRAARQSGAVVVLKGFQTLVAVPVEGGGGEGDGEGDGDRPPTVHVCPLGNPGMATGGSGDVLTGLVAALLAQLGDAAGAACLGVCLHALAGDLAAAERGEVSLAAGDLLTALPAAFRRLELEREAGEG